MVSAIGSNNSLTASSMLQQMQHKQRPSATEFASTLFSQLDTKNQGYFDISDLQSALDKANTATSSTGSSAASASTSASTSASSTLSANDIFSALDTDGNGKVTEQELSSVIQSLSDQLDSQFNNTRMNSAMANATGSMPPPPPPSGSQNDAGFTKDQLTSMVSEVSSTDSQRADFMTSIVNNFSAADTNSDGKVSNQEAMAYAQSQQSGSSTTSYSYSTSTSNGATNGTDDENTKILRQMMMIMDTYGRGNNLQDLTLTASSISISA